MTGTRDYNESYSDPLSFFLFLENLKLLKVHEKMLSGEENERMQKHYVNLHMKSL